MRSILPCVAALGLVAAQPCGAQMPPEQLQSFLNRVPQWGEPTREALRQEALREQYDSERRRATARRGAISPSGSTYEKDVELRNMKMESQQVLDDWGEPDSVYTNGDYQRRTYRRNGNSYSITTEDGLIKDFSSYETR